jgi:ABC-2 type transport system permease protein
LEAPNLVKLIYRNIKVNTDPGSLIILLGLPAMYLVFFGYGFGAISSSGGSPSGYLSYLAPGIMAFQAVMAGTVGGSMLWADRRYGMLAQLLVGPFTRLQYLLGIMFTSVLFGLGGAVVMFAVSFALLTSGPGQLLAFGVMFASIAVGSIFFGSLMLFISALVRSNNAYNSIQILVIFLVNFASTVFYPLSPKLPSVLHVLFLVNPLTYVADAVRGAYLGNFSSMDGLELAVLFVEMIVVLFLATRAYMRSDVSLE